MRGWLHVRFFPLALLQICLWPHILCAQLPPRLERCLPYPTLAQEISAMNEEPKLPASEPPPPPKVIIASIAFAPGTHIPPSVRDRIIGSIKSPQLYDDPDQSWLQELQKVAVLGTLLNSGYYRATVRAEAHLVEDKQRRRPYALTLHIEEGWRYRLGDVRIESATDNKTLEFPTSELREQIPMIRGELFNASKLRDGLEAITKLYATKGYIDMVATPELHNDDDGGPLELVLKIDEGAPYHIGKIEFLGLDAKTQAQLRPQLKPGDPYNPYLMDELFIRRNKSLLPSDASRKDIRELKRNVKEGTVDLRFDFFTCPGAGTRVSTHGRHLQ